VSDYKHPKKDSAPLSYLVRVHLEEKKTLRKNGFVKWCEDVKTKVWDTENKTRVKVW